MKYISFDVGIKNLSYCIIDIIDDGFDIIDWNVITLCDNKEKVNQINFEDPEKGRNKIAFDVLLTRAVVSFVVSS